MFCKYTPFRPYMLFLTLKNIKYAFKEMSKPVREHGLHSDRFVGLYLQRVFIYQTQVPCL